MIITISTILFVTTSIIAVHKYKNLIKSKQVIQKSKKLISNKKTNKTPVKRLTVKTIKESPCNDYLPIDKTKRTKLKSPMQIDHSRTLAARVPSPFEVRKGGTPKVSSELNLVPYSSLVDIHVKKVKVAV